MGVNVPSKQVETKFEYFYYEPIKQEDVNLEKNHNQQNRIDRPNFENLKNKLTQPAHWSQDGMVTKETGFCNKECEGVMLVQPACISDKTNEVVDDKLCHGKPHKTSAKYVPCNTHCKYT